MTIQLCKSLKPGDAIPEGQDQLFDVVSETRQHGRELRGALRADGAVGIEQARKERLPLCNRRTQIGLRDALGLESWERAVFSRPSDLNCAVRPTTPYWRAFDSASRCLE